MDWLRRNWPDLLIGIALIAVIAGIVATLLTGGSFFPIGPGQSNTPISTPSVNTPASPAVGQSNAPAVTPETPGGAPAESPDAGGPAPAADAGDDAAAAAQPGNGAGAIAVLPPAGDAAGDAAAQADAAAPTDTQAEAPAQDQNSQPAQSAQPAQSSQPAASAQPVGSDAAPTAPYRVSVGAFGSEPNAQRQADTFREAGFPVFLGRQGDLVLVLVGPYDTEQEAAQAVSRIRTGEFGIDPVIYRFQPDDEAAADASVADAAPASEPAGSASQAAAPAATADGTFLQVGAYATRESALPQIERLEGMGFDVTERTESGLVKLLVGPFEGDGLATARQQLQAEGIENFAR